MRILACFSKNLPTRMQYLIRKAPLRQPFEKMRVDARSVQKTPAGTPKNVHPCTFFGCEFAMRTRFSLEPPPSMAVLIRRGLFFVKRQRRCPYILKEPLWQYPFRKPFEIDGTDTRRERKLTAGLLKSVLPCTLFNDKFF